VVAWRRFVQRHDSRVQARIGGLSREMAGRLRKPEENGSRNFSAEVPLFATREISVASSVLRCAKSGAVPMVPGRSLGEFGHSRTIFQHPNRLQKHWARQLIRALKRLSIHPRGASSRLAVDEFRSLVWRIEPQVTRLGWRVASPMVGGATDRARRGCGFNGEVRLPGVVSGKQTDVEARFKEPRSPGAVTDTGAVKDNECRHYKFVEAEAPRSSSTYRIDCRVAGQARAAVGSVEGILKHVGCWVLREGESQYSR